MCARTHATVKSFWSGTAAVLMAPQAEARRRCPTPASLGPAIASANPRMVPGPKVTASPMKSEVGGVADALGSASCPIQSRVIRSSPKLNKTTINDCYHIRDWWFPLHCECERMFILGRNKWKQNESGWNRIWEIILSITHLTANVTTPKHQYCNPLCMIYYYLM